MVILANNDDQHLKIFEIHITQEFFLQAFKVQILVKFVKIPYTCNSFAILAIIVKNV